MAKFQQWCLGGQARKLVTWIPGTTQLYGLGHMPSLSGCQFFHLNNVELDHALQIPEGNESNLEPWHHLQPGSVQMVMVLGARHKQATDKVSSLMECYSLISRL